MPKRDIHKVLILEIGGSHIECVHTMVHLLHVQLNTVHLACNEKLIASVIEKDKLAGILSLPNEISKSQQFGVFFNLRKYINKHGIGTLIVNTTEITIVRDMLLFLPKLNYVGVVHNAVKLEKSFTLTKLIGRRIKKIFVLGNYLLQQIKPAPVFTVHPFFPVYFPLPSPITITKQEGDLWIVVPGVALNKRRDYAGLLTALKKYDLPSSLRFIFLGIYDLDDIVTGEMKASAWWKDHFTVFNGFVDYNTFHSYMQKSDVVLPLMRMEGDDFYGSSRISGSFNLGLGYKLPFILPDTYRHNTDLQPYAVYYSNMDELVKILVEFNTVHLLEQKAIKENYAAGPFNHIDAIAGEVCNFIFSK